MLVYWRVDSQQTPARPHIKLAGFWPIPIRAVLEIEDPQNPNAMGFKTKIV